MKRKKTTHVLGAAVGITVVLAASGCDDLIVSNLLLGAHEGALTAATGIIDGFFEDQFGIEAADEGGDRGEEKEGGNDLFIGL